MFLNLNENQTKNCTDENFFQSYAIFLQSLLLIISNFFLLPAVYLALKCKYLGEAFIYLLTMLCSSIYHLCDNEKMKYCLLEYEVLQFCDFYSAILTLWATAVLMADLAQEWRSALHLTGSLLFAGLLRAQTTGTWSFVVPGFCSLTLIGISWIYQYYYKNLIPSSLSMANLIPGAALSMIGAILFASQVTMFGKFYGYTHSGWHICMSLAISFLLPKTLVNQININDYSDKICVLSINSDNESIISSKRTKD